MQAATGTQHRSSDPHVRLSERPRLADAPEGKFGRLFPDLPCHTVSGEAVLRYGAAGGPLEDREGAHASYGEDNPRIPAGWPFFGQFIAHDITHDRALLNPKLSRSETGLGMPVRRGAGRPALFI